MPARGLVARRSFLAATVASASILSSACSPRGPSAEGSFTATPESLGHLLRERRTWPEPRVSRRTQVLIAGGGIAGLAAARALRQRGIEDFVLLDAQEAPGGNSQAGVLQGIACPLGAHYLPVPGDDAPEVQALLEELGLRRRVAGRWTYDERHLCHAPQERLFFQDAWQPGLLPVQGVSQATLAQYRRFADRVAQARRQSRFAIPLVRHAAARMHPELDALRFSDWLAREGLDDPSLRWYLDYCCRDDYGAGVETVSAWAGLHYFAARHGFHAPGGEAPSAEPVLTWPEGNGWLARALADPLAERFRGGVLVQRIAERPHAVEVDAWNPRRQEMERWIADRCIVALPVHAAARVVEGAPDALRALAARTRHAPWVVVNLHLRAWLDDLRGAQRAWDNVVYGSQGLGYVVATHQALDPRPGPTVLTWYHAPGEAQRRLLLEAPWTHWRDLALADLARAHPDLAGKLTHTAVTRYGHAMAIPVPGTLAALPVPPATGRLRYAHSDWAGYSIFEEAFALGDAAGRSV